MASLFSLVSLLSLTFAAAAAAAGAAVPNYPLPYDFKHVCDEKRCAKLGLQMSQFSFCDKSLSYPVRAKHLVDSMTLTEKVKQLGNTGDQQWTAVAKGVPRLGIPTYNWWSEVLHGVADTGSGSTFGGPVKAATSFPLPISTAATFNETLWKEIGKVSPFILFYFILLEYFRVSLIISSS